MDESKVYEHFCFLRTYEMDEENFSMYVKFPWSFFCFLIEDGKQIRPNVISKYFKRRIPDGSASYRSNGMILFKTKSCNLTMDLFIFPFKFLF